jgi:hypothetical protein
MRWDEFLRADTQHRNMRLDDGKVDIRWYYSFMAGGVQRWRSKPRANENNNGR